MKGISIVLAKALNELIIRGGGTIYARLNLNCMIASCVYSMLESLELDAVGKKKEFYKRGLDEVNRLLKELEELREAYEFQLDEADYATEKRAVFEKRLDRIYLDLTRLITIYDLLDINAVGYIFAE